MLPEKGTEIKYEKDPTAVYHSQRGLDIIFPFEPYNAQKKYMDVIINALCDKQNALLESPTGTGKTFSLLCSTLSWSQACNS